MAPEIYPTPTPEEVQDDKENGTHDGLYVTLDLMIRYNPDLTGSAVPGFCPKCKGPTWMEKA
jgi:hypothetical protein